MEKEIITGTFEGSEDLGKLVEALSGNLPRDKEIIVKIGYNEKIDSYTYEIRNEKIDAYMLLKRDFYDRTKSENIEDD